MKKKISLLLLTVILTLGLFGCGSKNESKVAYNTESLEQVTDTIISSFSQMSDEDFDKFLEGSELEVDLTLMQTGLPVDRDAFISMIQSWMAASKDCGSYVQHDDYEVEESSSGLIFTTNAKFEKKDATISFVFNEKSKMESMTVDAKYTTSEILKKAGLNTLLGMGTVFVVLIFISLIISLFKYIPAIEAKFSKKSLHKTTDIQAEPVAINAVEEACDDLELVAVITAAIAASTGTSSDGFVVRSIKRRKTNKWN
ncbi:OadG family transporter subunit [Lachnospiraceae bacterium LCP25S3_G4]